MYPFDSKVKNMLDLLNLPDKIKLEVSKSDLIAFADYLLNHQSKAIEFDDEFISISEVMQLTGKARQTIYGRVSKGTIPYYKDENGGKLRFKKSEILEWMKSGMKKTEADIQKEIDTYIKSKKSKAT